MKMIVRKDGHWKEVIASDADDARKKIDAEFADLQKPLVLILPDAAPSAAPAPAKKGK